MFLIFINTKKKFKKSLEMCKNTISKLESWGNDKMYFYFVKIKDLNHLGCVSLIIFLWNLCNNWLCISKACRVEWHNCSPKYIAVLLLWPINLHFFILFRLVYIKTKFTITIWIKFNWITNKIIKKSILKQQGEFLMKVKEKLIMRNSCLFYSKKSSKTKTLFNVVVNYRKSLDHVEL